MTSSKIHLLYQDYFFYNRHRVKSSLLSLKLSFCITAVILADNSLLCDDSKLRGSIIKNYSTHLTKLVQIIL